MNMFLPLLFVVGQFPCVLGTPFGKTNSCLVQPCREPPEPPFVRTDENSEDVMGWRSSPKLHTTRVLRAPSDDSTFPCFVNPGGDDGPGHQSSMKGQTPAYITDSSPLKTETYYQTRMTTSSTKAASPGKSTQKTTWNMIVEPISTVLSFTDTKPGEMTSHATRTVAYASATTSKPRTSLITSNSSPEMVPSTATGTSEAVAKPSDILDPEDAFVKCSGPKGYSDPINVKHAVEAMEEFCEKMNGKELLDEPLSDAFEVPCLQFSPKGSQCKAKVKFQVERLQCQGLTIDSSDFKGADCRRNLKRIIHGCDTITYKKYGGELKLGGCVKWLMFPEYRYAY